MSKKAADDVKFELEQETKFGPSFLVKDKRRKKDKPRPKYGRDRKESLSELGGSPCPARTTG